MNLLNDPAVEGETLILMGRIKDIENRQLAALDQLYKIGQLDSKQKNNAHSKKIEELRKIIQELPLLIKNLEVIVELAMKQGYHYSIEDTPTRLSSKKNTPFQLLKNDAIEQYKKAKDEYEKNITKGGRKFSKKSWAKKNIDALNKKHKVRKEGITIRTLEGYLADL